MGFLDSLPLNGYKTYLILTVAAFVLGLMQLQVLDPAIGKIVLEWLAIFGGATVAHKIDKARK